MLKELFRTEPRSKHFADEEVDDIVAALELVAPKHAKNLFNGERNIAVIQPLVRCLAVLAVRVHELEARVAELEGNGG